MDKHPENYDPGSIFVDADSSNPDKRDAAVLLEAAARRVLQFLARNLPLALSEQAQAIVLQLGNGRALVAFTDPDNAHMVIKVSKSLNVRFLSVTRWTISPEQYSELKVAIYGDTGRDAEIKEITPIVDWTELSEHLEVADVVSLETADVYPFIQGPTDEAFAAENVSELNQFALHILLEANTLNASDIFIESGNRVGRICYRQDAFVYTRYENVPPHVLRQLVNIFATMAGVSSHNLHLGVVDTILPLRGIATTKGTINADYRCCFAPTRRGVDLTLRNNFEEVRPIAAIGFEEDSLKAVLAALKRPQGLILLCGPTGEGKSITREAMLRVLEDWDCLKIFEWGDPIEFPSDRRTQIEINRGGVSWADASKAALRSNPNVITPSEFRDEPEAQWVVKASATGHLVITTFHATNVAAAFSRLLHLHVRPYDLAEHLTAIISQRLVRLLCRFCKVPDPAAQAQGYAGAYTSPYELARVRNRNSLPWQQIHQSGLTLANFERLKPEMRDGPRTCDYCADAGYRGRTAILEVLYVTPAARDLIFQLGEHGEWSARQVLPVTGEQIFATAREEARSLGLSLITLEQAAAAKVKDGLTSLNEINRVLAVNPLVLLGGHETRRDRPRFGDDIHQDSDYEGEPNVKSSAVRH